MTDLTGKTAVITGSARGIGKAIALRYAALGANIVVNYRQGNADTTLAEIQKLGAKAIAVQADMSAVADIDRLFTESVRHFGAVDIAVANAGIERIGIPFTEITETDFDELYAINTKGTFFTLQAAARHVAHNGRIILVSSSTTLQPIPGEGLYGSSKTAARYAVGVLAQEISPRGITVNAIVPTAIEGAGVFTEPDPSHPIHQIVAQQHRIGSRMGTVNDVADAAEYFASDIAAWVSGQSLLISGAGQQ